MELCPCKDHNSVLFPLSSCVLQEDPIFKRYKKMNEAMVGLVEDYSLVSFVALTVQVKTNIYYRLLMKGYFDWPVSY